MSLQILIAAGLSVRTVNAISAYCQRVALPLSRKTIERAIQLRTLHPSSTLALGFGQKALREARAWLGLKPAITGQQVFEWRSKAVLFLMREMPPGTKLKDIGRMMRMSKVQAERHWRHGLRLTRPERARRSPRSKFKVQSSTVQSSKECDCGLRLSAAYLHHPNCPLYHP